MILGLTASEAGLILLLAAVTLDNVRTKVQFNAHLDRMEALLDENDVVGGEDR